jgi:hypothetical protein
MNDDASERWHILENANEFLRDNMDMLPLEGKVGELLSERYTMDMDKLRQLSQHILILQTILKARL